MNCKRYGSGCEIIYDNLLAFMWRKLRQTHTISVRTAKCQAQHLLNSSQLARFEDLTKAED
jgi:hypothetical protein